MDAFPFWVFWPIGWVMAVVLLADIARRRDPAAGLAWLTILVTVPFVGLPAYIFIGRNQLPQRRIRHRNNSVVPLPAAVRQVIQAHHTEASEDSALRLVLPISNGLGDLPLVDGNTLDLSANTNETFAAITRDVEAAADHVHMLFYIWEDDPAGRAMIEVLLAAVGRGVKVRVLADAVGSKRMLRRHAPRMRAAGVEVVTVLPVGPLRALARRIDLRNHRKLVVIDGRIAYTGSQNVTDAINRIRRVTYYDVMLRLRGPIVALLQQVFLEDWFYETEQSLAHTVSPVEEAGEVAVQAVPSGPNYPSEAFLQLMVTLIHLAQERVVLTTPYFIPEPALLVALETAVRRGVTVDLVIPRRSDQWVAGTATRAYGAQVAAEGVRVHLFQDGVLHTKSMTVDGALTVIGTGNLDVRSFFLNLELNLFVPDAGFTARVEALQQGYIEDAQPLELSRWHRRPRWRRWTEAVARLWSPLL